MNRTRRGVRVLAVAAMVVVAVTAVAATGSASPNLVVAAAFQYAPREVVIVQGTALTFVNADTASHDVTAIEPGPDGEPLFHSATIGRGTSPVAGVAALTPNTYSFYCRVHTEMEGLLTVVGAPE